MTNNNQNQMGPPPPSNYPHQAVELYPNPYLFQGWNNFSYHVPPDQPTGSNQPPWIWMNHQNGGHEGMTTSNQITPPNAMEPPRDTPPSKPRKSQSQKMDHPKSKNLNHFQKCRLYMGFKRMERYPTDLEMRVAANDMNVEDEAVVEYFRDLHSRDGIPLPSDPFEGLTRNESNDNPFQTPFSPNTGKQETSNAAPNQSIPDTGLQAAPQPRALKRASTTVPEFASKCRRQDSEPME